MEARQAVEESIKHSIRKNGYPEKIVRLPFKAVYDSCKQHDASLSDVLEHLSEEQIFGKIKGNVIEFKAPGKPDPVGKDSSPAGIHPTDFPFAGGTPDLDQLQQLGLEYLAKMTPEQIEELRDRVANLSDEEKANILKMFTQMKDPS
ncbi:MAG: hypothetical protein ACE5EK_02305 [Nitrospinales bacterium]